MTINRYAGTMAELLTTAIENDMGREDNEAADELGFACATTFCACLLVHTPQRRAQILAYLVNRLYPDITGDFAEFRAEQATKRLIDRIAGALDKGGA